jgi:hypothetical protein
MTIRCSDDILLLEARPAVIVVMSVPPVCGAGFISAPACLGRQNPGYAAPLRIRNVYSNRMIENDNNRLGIAA